MKWCWKYWYSECQTWFLNEKEPCSTWTLLGMWADPKFICLRADILNESLVVLLSHTQWYIRIAGCYGHANHKRKSWPSDLLGRIWWRVFDSWLGTEAAVSTLSLLSPFFSLLSSPFLLLSPSFSLLSSLSFLLSPFFSLISARSFLLRTGLPLGKSRKSPWVELPTMKHSEGVELPPVKCSKLVELLMDNRNTSCEHTGRANSRVTRTDMPIRLLRLKPRQRFVGAHLVTYTWQLTWNSCSAFHPPFFSLLSSLSFLLRTGLPPGKSRKWLELPPLKHREGVELPPVKCSKKMEFLMDGRNTSCEHTVISCREIAESAEQICKYDLSQAPRKLLLVDIWQKRVRLSDLLEGGQQYSRNLP